MGTFQRLRHDLQVKPVIQFNVTNVSVFFSEKINSKAFRSYGTSGKLRQDDTTSEWEKAICFCHYDQNIKKATM